MCFLARGRYVLCFSGLGFYAKKDDAHRSLPKKFLEVVLSTALITAFTGTPDWNVWLWVVWGASEACRDVPPRASPPWASAGRCGSPRVSVPERRLLLAVWSFGPLRLELYGSPDEVLQGPLASGSGSNNSSQGSRSGLGFRV